ncbi:TRAP transporter large permease [Rhodococcus artemisiae]|uniref:TRAP transporter large permease subunit n=1 Tax=Rhodococcus artemisiae TaxID=714159 RepID=A0ABU7LFX8_9NOCA|nr:TRAP transporter large permease subunit [Rhodococcus artemisiae]MEE2060450.1 TRAP transporter large permease subunit [Rhodococcus artemisiae]
MTVMMVVSLVLVLFFVLLAIETPIFLALGGAGVIGIVLLRGTDAGTSVLASAPYNSTSSFTLAVIPMYVLLGMLALHGGLAERVYRVGSNALRSLPGGMGIATVAACAGFAAVSGSSIGTAASIGRTSVGEMRRYGYPAGFAAGIVAGAGTLGILIPPSSALVIYAVLSGESVAKLLTAGIIPGVMLACLMALYVFVRARRVSSEPQVALAEELALASGGVSVSESGTALRTNGSSNVVVAPRPVPSEDSGDSGSNENAHFTRGQLTRSVVWIGMIFVAIFVGIFTGLFTVTESAAIGALLALVMLLVENFRTGWRGLWDRVREATLESAAVTSMSFSLLVGASVFSTFLVMARIPAKFGAWLTGLQIPPILIVVLILAALIPLGMFLETMSIMVIFVPLVHPVVVDMGYSGLWFAILFVIMIELGLITPPVGMNVFVVSTTAKVKLETVFAGAMPMCAIMIGAVALLIAFPDIVTWLPSLADEP